MLSGFVGSRFNPRNFCGHFRTIVSMEAWLFSEPFHSNPIGWYRFATSLLGRIVFFSLLFTSGRLFAAETTVELSPLVAESTLLAPLDANKEIGVVLALPLSDPKGAVEYIQHVSQKGDPLYHHYLTPQQFADRFGGSAPDYATLKQWATANGLKISQESIARINLTGRGNCRGLQWHAA